jgi:isoleucyl-tRNA synthetase
VVCDHAYSSPELIEQVATQVAQRGIEYWDTVSVQELMPEGYSCAHCTSKQFVKERDILDVWFDSGVSHAAVLLPHHYFPADIYLEGKDQHRGWFQSSLLTSVVIENRAPMKMIVTHGFTVDSLGRKMSKSLNNGVAPQELIQQLGTDGLRLWAASIDCEGEAVVSDLLITNVKEVFRKIRNTLRFLLSNLYDFDYESHAVPVDQLLIIDHYALQLVHELNTTVITQYTQCEFTKVFHALADFCATDLSAFYMDVTKDRLYVEKADGHLRRSAQTAYWHILDTLTRLVAPILSFTAEQVSDHYQRNKTESIHLQQFASFNSPWMLIASQHAQWELLKQMRSAVLKAIEPLREKGIIKHPLEASVTLYFDATVRNNLALLLDCIDKSPQGLVPFLKEFFIASEVVIAYDNEGLEATAVKGFFVKITHAPGTKCPRCWSWEVTEHPDGLCRRCSLICLG